MAKRGLSLAQQNALFRAGGPWWVTGIQGAVLILVGLYLLLAPASAGRLIFQIIAIVLLIESVLHIVAELRLPRGEANPYTMLQAGIGVTIGVFLVLRNWLVPALDAESARNMLGVGLIAYALVGAVGALLARDQSESFLRPIVNALLLIILALVLLTSSDDNAADRLGLLGWIAVIGGAVLLFLAWRAYTRPPTT